jgi:hypothetical protein
MEIPVWFGPGLLLLVLAVNVAILVYGLLSTTYRILYRIEMWLRTRLIDPEGRPDAPGHDGGTPWDLEIDRAAPRDPGVASTRKGS